MIKRRLEYFWLVVVLILGSGNTVAGNGLLGSTEADNPLQEWPACPLVNSLTACFDFEGDGIDAWHSPDWFAHNDIYAPASLTLATGTSTSGNQSLQLQFSLPDEQWAATGIRWTGPLNLDHYGWLSAEIYLPPEFAERSLSARFILVAGDQWEWHETRQSTPLQAGQWITLRSPLAARLAEHDVENCWGDNTASLVVAQSLVQEVLIRIEASATNTSNLTPFDGKVLIDHIRLTP